MAGAGTDQPRRRPETGSIRSSGPALRPAGNDVNRFCIAAVGAVKDPKTATAACQYQIVLGVDGHVGSVDGGVGSTEDPNWRDVSLRRTVEDFDHPAGLPSNGDENFVVNRIDVQLIGVNQSGPGTLNHPNRSLLPVGTPAERHNGVGKGIRHD